MTQSSPVAAGRRSSPHRLYDWTVLGGGPGGVTDDPAIAAGHVQDELENAPEGTVGTVHRVSLAWSRPNGGYADLGEVARARRTADGVVWVEPGAER